MIIQDINTKREKHSAVSKENFQTPKVLKTSNSQQNPKHLDRS